MQLPMNALLLWVSSLWVILPNESRRESEQKVGQYESRTRDLGVTEPQLRISTTL
jgi:hypothetical protein